MPLIPKRFTVTAALPYANGPLHIGHIAGCYLPADIYVRYLRLQNKDVIFICGSDEHGVPITIKAKNEGVNPQQVVDKYNQIMKSAFADFGISFDIYSRTSAQVHKETAQDFFKNLHQKGVFEEKISQQYYDAEFQMFLSDRNITGTCPKCGNESAYGDQCERCGSSLDPLDLINPISKLSNKKPELKATKHWYLPLNVAQEQWLEKWIDEHNPNSTKEGKEAWKNNVYGQCRSWLNQGLQARAVTRDLDWGVPVPLPNAEGKVLYVWFDAPIGYISATKDYFLQNKSNAKNNVKSPNWETYWKDEDSKLVHFIGKDNIVFHCIVFPAMLKAHGEFILPENIPANEFLNLEGDKISTSRSWAVWLHEYLKDMPNMQDVLRYVLCANAPETKDNDFTWKDFQARNNGELVAILGNFVNRSVVLTHKYYDGVVPAAGAWQDIDLQLIEEMSTIPAKIGFSIESYRFREAQFELMNLARLGNKYLAETEPWKLAKTDPERVKTIMNLSLQISASLAILMQPFLPFTAAKLANLLNMDELEWTRAASANLLSAGHKINQAALLFAQIEDETINAQIERLENSKKENAAQNARLQDAKDEISFEDFSKTDIRVATIVAAEKVAKANKLLQLTIDTGLDKRTVVSGIAEFYKPEDIIGRQVCVLINLAPRKIKGIESQGMILMAEDAQGQLSFLSPVQAIMNGSTIR